MNNFSCNLKAKVRSRREFLAQSSFGFGSLALGYLLGTDNALASSDALVDPLASKSPHFRAKAKNVIFIFLQGGASQVDTFDPKPTLTRLNGQPLPPSFLKGEVGLAQIKAEESKLMATRREFKRCGQSGLEISNLFSNLANFADDL